MSKQITVLLLQADLPDENGMYTTAWAIETAMNDWIRKEYCPQEYLIFDKNPGVLLFRGPEEALRILHERLRTKNRIAEAGRELFMKTIQALNKEEEEE